MIRAATAADVPRLVELLGQLSLDTPREHPASLAAYTAAFTAISTDSRQSLLVLESSEDGVVGMLVLCVIPNLSHQGKPWAIVEDVVVDERHRGKGYGEQLLRYAVERAREAGCFKVSLTSNKVRKDAHRLYERLGFRATHEGFRIEW